MKPISALPSPPASLSINCAFTALSRAWSMSCPLALSVRQNRGKKSKNKIVRHRCTGLICCKWQLPLWPKNVAVSSFLSFHTSKLYTSYLRDLTPATPIAVQPTLTLTLIVLNNNSMVEQAPCISGYSDSGLVEQP